MHEQCTSPRRDGKRCVYSVLRRVKKKLEHPRAAVYWLDDLSHEDAALFRSRDGAVAGG